MNNVKNNKFNIWLLLSICLVVVCVGVFLFLAIRYITYGGVGFDGDVIKFSTQIQNNFLTGFFKVLTHFGSFITIGILSLIMTIVIKPFLVKIFAVVNVGFVGVFCVVCKHIVKRPRPVGINLIEETCFSFPSAHAMISVVFYGFLIFLIWKFIKNKPLKIVLTILFSLLAVTIGYTRVYLGVHFTSDILAGIFAGIAYLIFAIWSFVLIEKRLQKRKNNEKD